MKQPICANNEHKRITGLDSVEASDGRLAVVVWEHYVMGGSGRPIVRRRALCASCIRTFDWDWQQKYADEEGLPLGRMVAIVEHPTALRVIAARPIAATTFVKLKAPDEDMGELVTEYMGGVEPT